MSNGKNDKWVTKTMMVTALTFMVVTVAGYNFYCDAQDRADAKVCVEEVRKELKEDQKEIKENVKEIKEDVKSMRKEATNDRKGYRKDLSDLKDLIRGDRRTR